MSTAAKLAIAIVLFFAGTAVGIKYHAGLVAIAAQQADDIRQTDARQQRQFVDLAAGQHAAALAIVSSQLGKAREKIATLPRRDCLAPDLVGVLNNIGSESVRAAAVDPSRAADAAALGTGLRFSTDADTATAIAICRARYVEVSSQLHKILDIEARRHPELETQ